MLKIDNLNYPSTADSLTLFCGFKAKFWRIHADVSMATRRYLMGIKKAAIYTRVSTMDQHPEMQKRELVDYVKRRGWSLYREYSDKGVSGAIERRRALDELLEDCRRKKIDIVVVWKFDRFARSLKQLLNALELFRTLNIGFVSCTEAIDTSLPQGEMLFQIIGAIAQWEKSLIGERVRAGIQHARSQGKRLGRPPLRVLTPEEVAKLRKERVRTKAPFRKLAARFGCSVWSAHRLCSRHRQSAT
jgi:DNA invertase Pin-like site-specific DNA recombinase